MLKAVVDFLLKMSENSSHGAEVKEDDLVMVTIETGNSI